MRYTKAELTRAFGLLKARINNPYTTRNWQLRKDAQGYVLLDVVTGDRPIGHYVLSAREMYYALRAAENILS